MGFSDKVRTAAGPPPFPPKGQPPSFTPSKRKIPASHPYDPKSLKPMARMLWAMSISLGHALTAYRQFNRVKSVTISPDGLLGGHGYIMSVADVRKKLYEACEALSAISDTLHDEINAPHWKPRLAELDPNTAEDVERFVDESTKMLSSPEEDAEEEMDRIEKSNDAKWKAKGVTPKDDEPASEVPTDGSGGQGEDNVFHGGWGGQQKEASLRGQTRFVAMIDERASWGPTGLLDAATLLRLANSSEPVDNLDGPRVNHIGPSEGQGPFGTYNDEPGNDDAWRQNMGGHAELGWREGGAVAESGLPSDPETKTDADDFGLGYGRKGDGSKGYGTTSPDGKGFWGPQSGLPDDPGGKTRDPEGDITTPVVEMATQPGRNVWAETSELPNDLEPPVARTDYFPGYRGNTVSQSEVPGDESVTYNYDRDLPNTGQVFEHTDNPYIKWDDSTKNYRPDTTYQRRPREG